MTQVDDLSRCLATLDENSTLVAVVEMSQSSWLTAGLVPGVDRRPLKKLEHDHLKLVHSRHGRCSLRTRWR
jgi:transposase